MKKALLILAAVGTFAVSNASAGFSFNLSIGHRSPHVVYAPAPVYCAPAPPVYYAPARVMYAPPVAYCPPPRVFYAPAPVYCAPVPAYAPVVVYGYEPRYGFRARHHYGGGWR